MQTTVRFLGYFHAGCQSHQSPRRPCGSILIQWNTMAYSIGEAILGVGHLFLCSLLFRTRLVPRFLAVGGFVG